MIDEQRTEVCLFKLCVLTNLVVYLRNLVVGRNVIGLCLNAMQVFCVAISLNCDTFTMNIEVNSNKYSTLDILQGED